MSRQAIGLIIVIAVLGGLLLIRGFIGHGMGRVYTETVTKEFVEVDVPAADPMMVDEKIARFNVPVQLVVLMNKVQPKKEAIGYICQHGLQTTAASINNVLE